MEKQTHIVVRKIQLLIDCANREQRRAYYGTLFEWQSLVFRGSNLVLTHQYIQERIPDFIYLQDEIRVKLANRENDEQGIFTTSRLNSTYQLLSHYFKGKVPAKILTSLNVSTVKCFNRHRLAYWKGERSLATARRDVPIPFSGLDMKFTREGNSKEFKCVLFKIPFRTYLGKDPGSKRKLLEKAMAGQIKVCGSLLQIRKGKIYILLSLELPKVQLGLQPYVIAEASLTLEYPISVKIDNKHYQIGTKEEFLYRRLAIQSARNRLQKAASFAKGGHGRKRKTICIAHFEDKEKRYVESRLHSYSRKLIDICMEAGAGTLLLVNQATREEFAKEDRFVLRNWSYYGLIQKIKYKADRVGIEVIVE
ncbi:IS200/IS605 family element transposase accessory protein TnpB [Sphingobacterium paludis]|nr:IS200/IS605 family element transposase accessory protein TnpB [Sphingobacterium paludis]